MTTTCPVGAHYLVIDHQGNIAKCQMDIAHPVTSIAAADPLGAVRADQQRVQNVSVDQKEGCQSCEWRYWCAGGCPLVTHQATGRYDVQSPLCGVYRALFPDIIRLEGLRLAQQEGIGNRE
ncbi:MAG: SPASM domain-containing protein [Chloroflexaceae bacterium]|nr:SPASM domain-containing protein [Chloroflexaceae bacterium]